MSTVEQLTEDLADYRAAKKAILLGGQSYGIAGRNLTRADLPTIEKMIKETEIRLEIAQNNGALTYSTPELGMSR